MAEPKPIDPKAPGDEPQADIHHLEAQRRANRDALVAMGVAPYGKRRDGLVSLAEARARYVGAADEEQKARAKEPGFVDRRPVVSVAGRVALHRDGGKLVWMQLRDHTSAQSVNGGDLQIAVSQRDCDETSFKVAKRTDLGDILVATGPLVKTKAGEITVWATSLEVGAKSLTPPPEKWAGLQDVEARYRRRYIDLYANPAAMRAMLARSTMLTRIRRFMQERSFVEVETPILQTLPGGAAARPFETHMHALDIRLYLRIAPELYLKRLLVGGLARVFELGRNLRNEGLSRKHNPEFTALEVYEAFGDSGTMMELTESLIRSLAHAAAVDGAPADGSAKRIEAGKVRLAYGEWSIDYGSPFARTTYAALFERGLGFALTDSKKVRAAAERHGLKTKSVADVFLVNELFEAVAEPTLDPAKPTFVTDYPAAISPLTRPRAENPLFADRWDLFIGGMECGTAYTELNDPDVQEAKFREQLEGADAEAQAFRTFDADFVEALRVGMPPAGGLGIGVDRVAMLLTDSASIRDVIAFPFMRPV